MTPTVLFNLFFDDDVMECIVDQTNLYANQVKNKPIFLTSVSEMKKILCYLIDIWILQVTSNAYVLGESA